MQHHTFSNIDLTNYWIFVW